MASHQYTQATAARMAVYATLASRPAQIVASRARPRAHREHCAAGRVRISLRGGVAARLAGPERRGPGCSPAAVRCGRPGESRLVFAVPVLRGWIERRRVADTHPTREPARSPRTRAALFDPPADQ